MTSLKIGVDLPNPSGALGFLSLQMSQNFEEELNRSFQLAKIRLAT
jgi:hypothetical protein